MDSEELGSFFSREAVLAGSPAKRADTILFLIENRTALLADRHGRRTQRLQSEVAERDRELVFLEAFALGREPSERPSVQDLERFAAEWADLVPDNARLRAAIAHRIGERFSLHARSIPGIRSALGLDDPDVRKAYRDLYDSSLERIFASTITRAERARWRWASFNRWLESLPPFWFAFSLTLTETVGATILALPIALATIGPLPGVAIIVLLGLINVLTIAYMSEAVARSGEIRRGNAYMGRFVGDFLGNTGSIVLSVALFVLCFLIVPIFYIGVGTTLEDVSPVGAPVWIGLLFVIGIYYVRRETLKATVSSALIIGTINIILILCLSVLAFGEARIENITYANVPFVSGRPFEASVITLIFGVVLAAYFGHTSVVLCGNLVLQRDPSGRSLIRGCVAAQIAAIMLYSLFVVAVGGAVGSERLASETGTALIPLSENVGQLALGLGTAFVILGMGMGSIHFTIALFNIVRERLSFTSSRTLALPAHRGTLLLVKRRPFGGRPRVRMGLVYRGSRAGRAQFDLEIRTGESLSTERILIDRSWDLEGVQGQEPGAIFQEVASAGGSLVITVEAADELMARVRIETNMRLELHAQRDHGIYLSELLSLESQESDLLSWLLREGEATEAQIAAYLNSDQVDIGETIARLVATGFLRREAASGTSWYSAAMGRRHLADLPERVWAALDTGPPQITTEKKQVRGRRFGRLLGGNAARFMIPVAPVAIAFAASEWMLITDSQSFAGLLGFAGAIVVSLLAGVFPALLLRSSRRKGENEISELRFVGHGSMLGAIYVFFLGAVLIHGIVIWDNPWERGGAFVAALATVGMTAVMARRGGFQARLSLELQSDATKDGRTLFRVMSGGRQVLSDVSLEYADGARKLRTAGAEIPQFHTLRRARFRSVPGNGTPAREVKVVAYARERNGTNESLQAQVEVGGGGMAKVDLPLEGGEVVGPLEDKDWTIDLVFPEKLEETGISTQLSPGPARDS